MEEFIIQASRREVVGKQVKALRRSGKMPAVLYGRRLEPIPITLDYRETSRILEGLSPSTLVVVQVDSDSHYALVREKQRDVLRGTLLHVDFQVVYLTEKVRTEVGITIVGEAPAVREFGAILVTSLESLEVEALPRDLPEIIGVDVSNLMEIGDIIHVRDLVLPEDVIVLTAPDEVVVVAIAPAAEVELEEEVVEEEFVEVEEPEVIERGKREEEE